MNAAALLARLQSLGVLVAAEGDRLRVSASAGQLSDELKASIAQAKPQLLALLAAHASSGTSEFPVSFGQRRLWFLDQLEPGNAAYHLAASHRITARLDPAAMEAAINDVVQRQDALRTVFRAVDGEPVQVVLPFKPARLSQHDLSQLTGEEHAAALRRLTREEAARPFDLARGPLFRAALVRLAADDWMLLFTMHHIVCDGWSLGIFLADLHVAYAARSAGHAPAFAPLALRFGQHAARERAALSGPALDDLLAYWRSRLGNASPTLALPTDRPRPSQRTFDGAALVFSLPPQVSDGLRALARSERATLYMTLLAVFKSLLFRYSDQPDIVIGTPVANRPASEVEHLIGMFVGTLPIRSDLSADLTWRALLRQVRENVLEAQAHAALPFEKMVDDLRPERTLAWSPVYQVIFAMQNAPLASAFEVTTVSSMVDLSLFVWDEPQGIRGTLEYNTALFDASTAEGLRDHFVALAESAVRTPDAAIGRMSMLSAALRHQLLEDWNATGRPYPRDSGLWALFEASVQRWPQRVALEAADASDRVLPVGRLTYADLLDGTDRVACQLRAQDVRPGDAVGLYLERSIGAIVALLSIVRLGAAYVPLDVNDPPTRTLGVLRDAGARAIVTDSALAPRLQGKGMSIVDLERAWNGAAVDAQAPAVASPDALAYIMFTSGTTGAPKGVCVTQRNVARLVCNPDYVELGPEERVLQFAPLAFDASTLEIWGALLNGARLVVHPEAVPTAAQLAEVLRRHRISTLWLTAGFFHHMVESEPEALAGVRQVLAGGDVLSVSHVQKLLDTKVDGVVVNGYGPTENTTFTCCHQMRPGERLADSVPIGRPIANTRVYLLDEYGEPVPPRVVGELYAAGDGVARGYLSPESGPHVRFLPDPFDVRAGARMYRTGDLARWRADGTIEFLGRRDRQVKVRGFRIELEEVEEALRHCPNVADAAAVVRRDASGSNSLIGYLVASGRSRIDLTAVKQVLAERCPRYMVPDAFVTLDALPLTASGKLDRAALPEPVAASAAGGRNVAEPRTMVEAQLHAILERVLGRSGIGVTDNFFELGGHSLLAVRFFTQIERAFGVKLPVSVLFVAPDIAQLAQRLQDQGLRSPWSSLVSMQPEGTRTPLFMVPGIGGNVLCYSDLGRLLGTDQPLYGLQSRGLDDSEQPFRRIEPMAAHYLAEIRKVQPRGPYRLGGTCFGGVVAYEMAQQLRRAGETVELLFLLESWPPAPARPIVDALRVHSHQIRFLVAATRRNLAALSEGSLATRVRKLLRGLKIVGQMAQQRDVYRGDRARMYVDRVSLANERALARYRVRPYGGMLRCAIAAKRPFTGGDARHIWRTMAPGDYVQIELPATDSGTMLLLPCAEPLATWMKASIDAVDAAAPRGADKA